MPRVIVCLKEWIRRIQYRTAAIRLSTLLRSLLLGARLRQTIRNDGICGRVERETDVGSGNFEIGVGISSQTITPVHDAVVTGVDGRLQHGFRNVAAKGIEEVAGTSTGVAGGQDSRAMFLQDVLAHGFGCLQHGAMGDGAVKWRSQSDDGRHIIRSLTRDRTGDDASQTMTDEMDLALRLKEGFFYTRIQTLLDEDIRAFGVNSDARKVRTISNATDPGVKLREISVGTK